MCSADLNAIEGFWLPASVRDAVIRPDVNWERVTLCEGRPATDDEDGAVSVQWPVLDQDDWRRLVDALNDQRARVPQGAELWERLQAALEQAASDLADTSNPLRATAMQSLPSYTGFSDAMIEFTLSSMDLFALDTLQRAMAYEPLHAITHRWSSMEGMPGRIRFYRDGSWLKRLVPSGENSPLFGPADPPEMMLGYGAGNVPGTALMIGFLGQAIAAAGHKAPAVIVKNSRREPIFSPLVLSAIEKADPDIVTNLAVLVWDYEDAAIQRPLMDRARLVIAAASDETIHSVGDQVSESQSPARFHAHGHKVSFSAISREFLVSDAQDEKTGAGLLDAVALLAALDSVFWDQFGCLSSRVHFVERGTDAHYSADDYAERLAHQLRLLAEFLPRGAWPGHWVHDRYDKYVGIGAGGDVRVISRYDDKFVVAVDERSPTEYAFQNSVNDCQARVILVRPVNDLNDIPRDYLSLIPSANLQSMSVAAGQPNEDVDARLLSFADACCTRGVTALRTVGRGAFPQLAYSWDGLIPQDLIRSRPAGRFATVEFDKPYDEIMETYTLLINRGSAWQTAAVSM
jgi:hypothetical protein